MWRGFILGIIVTVVVIAAAAYFGINNGIIPAAADAPTGQIERWVAGHDLHAVLSAQAPTTPNPAPLTDANLTEGVRLYAENCSVCHGTAAGDTAQSPVAKGEAPKP